MDTKIFKKHLQKMLQLDSENLEQFLGILKKYNAIIAGGFVLNAYHKYIVDGKEKSSHDMDIYVSMEKSVGFYDEFHELMELKQSVSSDTILTPPYDKSFLRKNKILARLFCSRKLFYNYFDIMVVSDTSSPMEVVNNFDLSFCEIWYNAKNDMVECKGSSEDILNKKGILNPDYVQSLIGDSNQFIMKRIEKYRERGFEITIPPTNTDIVIKENSKNVTDAENWVATKIFGVIMVSFYSEIRHNPFIVLREGNFELDYNMKKLKKFVSKYFIEYDSQYDHDDDKRTIEEFRFEKCFILLYTFYAKKFYISERRKGSINKFRTYILNCIKKYLRPLEKKIIYNEILDKLDKNKLCKIGDNVIFVTRDEILCFDKNYINNVATDINNWIYDKSVSEDIYEIINSKIYIKITIDSFGSTGLVDLIEYFKMLYYNEEKNGKFIFYLEKALDNNGQHVKIEDTIPFAVIRKIVRIQVNSESFYLYNIKVGIKRNENLEEKTE